MVTITPLASSSAGNAYHITNGKTALLLECGLPAKKLKKALWDKGLRLQDVAACLISHEHGDHCKGAPEVSLAGVPVFASRGTGCAIGRAKRCFGFAQLEDKTPVRIGTWTVLPFDVVHDAAEPLGFLLASGDDRVLFLTDSAYSPHTFAGLTHLIVECNYSAAALERAVEAGSTHPAQQRRLLHSHLSLEQLLKLLEANDLSRLQGTWLIHLSDDNSDEQEMLRAVRRATGRPVYVCAK